MAMMNAERVDRLADQCAVEAEGFGAGEGPITAADVRRVATRAAAIAIDKIMPEMLRMLEDAIPYVEESEQFNKPTHRGLSKRMKAVVGWGK